MAGNGHKARLGHGWIVCISKSHPDRLYYFNVNTGDSCWECPNLVSPADSTSTNKEFVDSKMQNKALKISWSSDAGKNVITYNEGVEVKNDCKLYKCLKENITNDTCDSNSEVKSFIEKNSLCNKKCTTTQEQPHSNTVKNPVRLRFKLKRPNCLKGIKKEPMYEKGMTCKSSTYVQQKKDSGSEINSDKIKLVKIKLAAPNDVHLLGKGKTEKKKKLSEENTKPVKLKINLPKKVIKLSEKEKYPSDKKVSPLEKRVHFLEKPSTLKKKSHVDEGPLIKKNPHHEIMKSPRKATLSVNQRIQTSQNEQPLTKTNRASQNVKKLKLLGKKNVELCSKILQSAECTSTISSPANKVINLNPKLLPRRNKVYIDNQSIPSVLNVQEDSSASDAEMLDVSTDLTCSNSYEPMQTEDCDVDKGYWIVVDTNILISELKFVDELKDLPLEGCGPPTIYIPWVVMQELDCLKDNKNKKASEINSSRAGVAVRHLYVWLTARHPRIRGQTSAEAEKQRKSRHGQSNDDAILECCLQLSNQVTKDQLILLTNDKNLCNKAVINNIRAHTRDSLLQNIKVDFSDKPYNIAENGSGSTISVPHTNTLTTVEMRKEVDKLICLMKMKLKQLLEPVVESGMKNAFGEDWSSLVIISPPWSLLDILYCLKKHWIAVFGSIFTRKAKGNVESLLAELKSSKGYIYDEGQASKLLNLAVSLCSHLQTTCGNAALQKMQELKLACDLLCLNAKQRSDFLFKNAEVVNDPYENHRKVLAIFQHIWDLINHLCGVILDSLNCHHDFNYTRPEILPSREYILDFIPKFYPQLQQLKRQMLSIVSPEPEVSYRKAVSHLFHLLHTFVPNLGVQAEEPPISGISEEIFFEFCTTVNNKDLLQNGYQQLIQFYDKIHKCVHGVL